MNQPGLLATQPESGSPAANMQDRYPFSLGIHVLSATYVLNGGCQVAEKDCRNLSLWVNLWVMILASQRSRGWEGWSRDVARWVRWGLSVSDPFGCRCLTSLTMLRFHIPLIEPDVRIARIRLSEKVSRGRPRKTMGPCGETDQAQLVVENGVRKLLGRLPRDTVLATQPLSQPLTSMSLHSLVGFADWS